jgi:predicted DNA binding CopG/RHH family protein
MAVRKIVEDPPFLDDEEREMIQAAEAAMEAGTLKSELTPARKAELVEAARQTLNPPKKQISARLFERDIIKLKARAAELGIPYQTLLTSIVHQYVEGRLVEKKV